MHHAVIEYKPTCSVALFLATKEKPKRAIRERLYYKDEESRKEALEQLERTRIGLLKAEGHLSLGKERVLDLPEDDPLLPISEVCVTRRLAVFLTLCLVEKGQMPSSFGLDPVMFDSLKRTGVVKGGCISPKTAEALVEFRKTITQIRGKFYSTREIVSILFKIEDGCEEGLKNMRITGLSVLALIDSGFISSAMLLNAIFGRPYALAWNKVTGYCERLKKLGFIETVYHDATQTHSLTAKGRMALEFYKVSGSKALTLKKGA